MKKNTMERKIYDLEWKTKLIEKTMTSLYLTVDEAKKRDYIVRTKYLGKITDKKIKEDFKIYIEGQCGDNFDSITNKILNYEFYFENKNILNLFSEALEKYEYKQLIMDTYGDKNEK